MLHAPLPSFGLLRASALIAPLLARLAMSMVDLAGHKCFVAAAVDDDDDDDDDVVVVVAAAVESGVAAACLLVCKGHTRLEAVLGKIALAGPYHALGTPAASPAPLE